MTTTDRQPVLPDDLGRLADIGEVVLSRDGAGRRGRVAGRRRGEPVPPRRLQRLEILLEWFGRRLTP